MIFITEDEFVEKWHPLPAKDGGHLWTDMDQLVGHPLNNVWTIVEGSDYGLYARPGYRKVNVIGWCVTLVPWADDAYNELEAVWAPPPDDEESDFDEEPEDD